MDDGFPMKLKGFTLKVQKDLEEKFKGMRKRLTGRLTTFGDLGKLLIETFFRVI
jgi:hypothetical protein